ncbi:MAG: Ni/Fe hydrogenase subunit alpha, partial [Ilumatobacteraceae bacterium]
MHVVIRGGQLQQVQLRIYEPPRFFEAFLRGRAYTEPPDITARICGICPIAYQMSACNAIEAACGATIDGPLADLRRLLYCGEWIESHTLHVYLLHAPDFLGYDGAIELATAHRDIVQRGLDLKKIGNQLVELIGGRAIHPVNVRIGGFYRVPTEGELRAFAPRLEQARDLALETVRWVAGFDFPDHRWPGELAALRHPGEYPITRGRLVSTLGLDIGPDEFDQHIVEEHVEHSTALHARILDRGEYLLGPLARFALNYDELTPMARDAAAGVGLRPDERNPFRSIIVRAVEILHACDEALAIIDRYREPDRPSV